MGILVILVAAAVWIASGAAWYVWLRRETLAATGTWEAYHRIDAIAGALKFGLLAFVLDVLPWLFRHIRLRPR